ncbi:hypothetical protein Tco_0715261, partial [Tanacetum coccineum]
MLNHPLSYALTATADVIVVYLQQFWKTVSKVSDIKDTIRYKLDAQEITYTIHMFRDTLKLLVETPDNPFISPVTIRTIGSFMQTISYQGIVDKVSAFYTKFLAQPCIHSPSVKNASGISIPRNNTFPIEYTLTATADYTEYKMVFVTVVVPMKQPQLVVSIQGKHRTTPKAHRTPTLTITSPQGKKKKQSIRETSSPRKSLKVTIRQKKQSTTPIPPPSDDRERDDIAEATLLNLTLYKTFVAIEAQENVAKVQEKLAEEEIEKMIEGDEDEESYAIEFADSMFNDDDDFGTRIEPGRHKENLKVDDDDIDIDVTVNEKKDDNVEKTGDATEEKDNVDHIDQTLVKTHAIGSMETRNKPMQKPIPTPSRSPRKDLSSYKTISKELTGTVSPTTATTSNPKTNKSGFTSNKKRIL